MWNMQEGKRMQNEYKRKISFQKYSNIVESNIRIESYAYETQITYHTKQTEAKQEKYIWTFSEKLIEVSPKELPNLKKKIYKHLKWGSRRNKK